MKVVVFLQNAWSPLFVGGRWPRESWLAALHRSRSGQRLRVFEKAAKAEIWYDNTTPQVGGNPDSVIPPDLSHISKVLSDQRPDIIVAMGKQAEKVISSLWSGSMLAVPHPAHRVLTNRLYKRAGQMIQKGHSGRCVLRQGRGKIKCELLAAVAQVA